MKKRTLIMTISFLNYMLFAAPVIYIEYILSKGGHIVPDLELGYAVNVNQIELILAILLVIVQVILLIIFLLSGTEGTRQIKSKVVTARTGFSKRIAQPEKNQKDKA